MVWLTSACSGAPTLMGAQAPDDVGFLAVVELDVDGRVLEGSPLARWNGSQAVWRRSASALIVGFSESSILALSPPEELGADRVEEAFRCDPRLPDPIWSAVWEGDTLTASEPSTPLTVPWLSKSCPKVASDQLALDVSCGPNPCRAEIEQTDPCEFTLSTRDCVLCDERLGGCEPIGSRTVVRVDRAGRLCFEPVDERIECALVGQDSEGTIQSCAPRADPERACVVRTYAPEPIASPFEIQRELLRPNVMPDPRVDPTEPSTNPSWVTQRCGQALDFALSEDRVFVSLSNEGPSGWCACDVANAFGEKQIRDRESLALIMSTSGPATGSCVFRIVPDPIGAGVLGTHVGADRSLHLGRFDREFEMVATAELAPTPASSPELELFRECDSAVEIAVVGDEIAVLVSQNFPQELRAQCPQPARSSRIYVLGLDALDFRAAILVPGGVAIDMEADPSGRLHVYGGLRTYTIVDPRTRTVIRQRTLDESDFITAAERELDLALLPGDRVAASLTSVGVLLVEGERERRALSYLGRQHASKILPWTDERLLVIGAERDPPVSPYSTYLNLLELEGPRFLPRRWPLAVGRGLVTRAKLDEEGRAWLLLGDDPSLLRVTMADADG